MAKFRKKPVVIEAEQFFPADWESHEPHQYPSGVYKQGDAYFVKTLEGPLKVSSGDWIVTGVQGEKYPVKPDIFEATYEPVDSRWEIELEIVEDQKEKRKVSDRQRREEQCLYEELKHVYPEFAIPDERTREEKKRDAEQDTIDLFGPEEKKKG